MSSSSAISSDHHRILTPVATASPRRYPVLRNLAKLLIVSAVTLFFFELIGQTLIFRDKLYFVNDPDHRMVPYSEDDINGDGIRSMMEADAFPAEDRNIVFLGDSFVYGWRLEYSESVPQQFEAMARARHPKANINVANFGWVSSSPLLSLRLLKDIGAKYNPDVVVLAVDMSDFEDDTKYHRLLERRGAYRGLNVVPITFLAIKRLTRNLPLLQPLHEPVFGYPAQRFFVSDSPWQDNLEYYQQIRSSIDAIADYTRRELDAEFVLFLFPRNYQYSDREAPQNWEAEHYEALGPYADQPFQYFESIRDELDYPMYSLLDDFQDTQVFPTCFNFDPHWNVHGSRVAAHAVYKDCLDAGCFGEPDVGNAGSPAADATSSR